MPPLCHAAFSNNLEGLVAMLTAEPPLAHPNDPGEVSWYGNTPLHYAVQYQYEEAASLLLAARASTETLNSMGQRYLDSIVNC